MLNTGDNVVVEAGAKLETLVVQKNGDITIGNITLSSNTVVGSNTHIGLGAWLGGSVFIKPLSVVPQGKVIEAKTIVCGQSSDTEDLPCSPLLEDKVAHIGWHLIVFLVTFLPHILFLGFELGAIYILSRFTSHTLSILLSLEPFILTAGQILIASIVRLMRLVLNSGKQMPGWERLYSKRFIRRRLATDLFKSTRGLLEGPMGDFITRSISKCILDADIDIHASFAPPPDEPDLTKIGEDTFGANGVKLQNFEVLPGGACYFGCVEICDYAMVLDRVVVAPGVSIKKDVQVGSITSVTKETQHDEGSLLLGNPALNLIRKKGDIDVKITREPVVRTLSF